MKALLTTSRNRSEAWYRAIRAPTAASTHPIRGIPRIATPMPRMPRLNAWEANAAAMEAPRHIPNTVTIPPRATPTARSTSRLSAKKSAMLDSADPTGRR